MKYVYIKPQRPSLTPNVKREKAMQAQDVLTTNVITATSETTLEEATAPMVASHASAMARLDPAYINVVVEGSRVDVWDLAGLDAEENAETTSRDI
ncbi:CBS domain-containing protein [Roseovarius indicus]|nr:CBS domain-containing protein [Roseovarius indicus]